MIFMCSSLPELFTDMWFFR